MGLLSIVRSSHAQLGLIEGALRFCSFLSNTSLVVLNYRLGIGVGCVENGFPSERLALVSRSIRVGHTLKRKQINKLGREIDAYTISN